MFYEHIELFCIWYLQSESCYAAYVLVKAIQNYFTHCLHLLQPCKFGSFSASTNHRGWWVSACKCGELDKEGRSIIQITSRNALNSVMQTLPSPRFPSFTVDTLKMFQFLTFPFFIFKMKIILCFKFFVTLRWNSFYLLFAIEVFRSFKMKLILPSVSHRSLPKQLIFVVAEAANVAHST